MKFYYFYFVVFLFFIGCSSKSRKESIDFFPAVSEVDVVNLADLKFLDPLNLSDIAENIEYIPLETNTNALIAHDGRRIHCSDSIIFIHESGKVMLFDRQGNFLQELFRVGQGPGECFAGMCDLNHKTREFYVYNLFRQKIEIYNFSGQHIKSIPNPTVNYYWPLSMGIYKDYILFDNNNFIPSFFSVFNISNLDSAVYVYPNRYLKELKNRVAGFDSNSVCFQNKDSMLYFKEQFCDTLFYTTDFSVTCPRYIFDWGKTKTLDFQTFSKIFTREITDSHVEDGRYRIVSWMEVYPYLFFVIRTTIGGDFMQYLGIYNNNKKTLQITKDIELNNDFDGGVNFIPLNPINNQNFYKNQIYTLVYPYKLMEAYAQNKSYSSPQRRKQLEKLVNSLSEDDNPILMIVTIKNDDNNTN
ncbi:MAG: 6-bladed beta-propeller [Tannerella sp.]|jgi:hypothetical protein|nr:6-bladed beta-propeller [Tannerella sp.]